jgi:hypothetical protein
MPVTPNETGADGKPLIWMGAPGTTNPQPGGPTLITVALATHNLPVDAGLPPPFTQPPFTHELGPRAVSLLEAAEEVWEKVANVKFVPVTDTATSLSDAADIRVGLADVSSQLSPPNSMTFVGGNTHWWYDPKTDRFLPDTTVAVEDPSEIGIIPLASGDFQYINGSGTMFQCFIHELGHALGLGHNTSDPTSVMNPILTSSNRVPDAQDIAAIRALYGPPQPGSPVLSQAQTAELNALLNGHTLA